MSVPTRKTLAAEQHIEDTLKDMPFYVNEFARAKISAGLSPITISGYLYDYKRFFDWLREEALTTAERNKDIPFTVLEKLKKKELEFFIDMLKQKKIQKSKDILVNRSDASVNRFIQSLKSLFNYLTIESENDDGECYFYRNVLLKIKTPKKSESTAYRAKRINSQILEKDEMEDLLDYVKHDFEKTLSERQRSRFKRDYLRDIAIISLFQGSGIRVNELASLQLTDIDARKDDISIRRKGSKSDTISITPSSMLDLLNYLEVRNSTYKPTKENSFVFLTKYGGVANPIAVETIQKLVNKYTKAFLSGKRLSPHKLRHSFAKKWLDEGGSLISLRDQLGHNTIETTVLYTNFSQEEQRVVLRKMDRTSRDKANEDGEK